MKIRLHYHDQDAGNAAANFTKTLREAFKDVLTDNLDTFHYAGQHLRYEYHEVRYYDHPGFPKAHPSFQFNVGDLTVTDPAVVLWVMTNLPPGAVILEP